MFEALDVARFVLGIAILSWGAEWLVRGASTFAAALGVPPLVLGLTVVAYGTAAPELAVATRASTAGAQPLVMGLVIGAYAANIALVMGITAMINPPTIDHRAIRRELPILFGVVVLVPIFLWDTRISRLEGTILVIAALLFSIASLTVAAKLSGQAAREVVDTRTASIRRRLGARETTFGLLRFGLGILVVVFGANELVVGARTIGRWIHLSDRMLGLTLVALGTVLPKLITAVVAARRGQSGLALGATLGATLLNVCIVIGVSAYLRPIDLAGKVSPFDLFGLAAITLFGAVMMRSGRRVSRWEGVLLVTIYVAFIAGSAFW